MKTGATRKKTDTKTPVSRHGWVTHSTEDGRVELIGRYIRSITQFDAFNFVTGLPTDGNNGNKANAYYFRGTRQKNLWWLVDRHFQSQHHLRGRFQL